MPKAPSWETIDDPAVLFLFCPIWNLVIHGVIYAFLPACWHVFSGNERRDGSDEPATWRQCKAALRPMMIETLVQACFWWTTHSVTFACVDPTGFTPPPPKLKCPGYLDKILPFGLLLLYVDFLYRIVNSMLDGHLPFFETQPKPHGRLDCLPVQYYPDCYHMLPLAIAKYIAMVVIQLRTKFNVYDVLFYMTVVDLLRSWSTYNTEFPTRGVIGWRGLVDYASRWSVVRFTRDKVDSLYDSVWWTLYGGSSNPFAKPTKAAP